MDATNFPDDLVQTQAAWNATYAALAAPRPRETTTLRRRLLRRSVRLRWHPYWETAPNPPSPWSASPPTGSTPPPERSTSKSSDLSDGTVGLSPATPEQPLQPKWAGSSGAAGLVATVGDHRGGGTVGSLRAGLLPGPAVVAVAGHRLADGDDQAGVGVDDDLVVGGVAVVLAGGGHGPVTGGNQRAVDDEHGVLAEPPPELKGESRPEVADDPVGPCGPVRLPRAATR